MLCQDVSSERVEGYVKALREYHRQLRIYKYQLNVVDKCDEAPREFLSRVVMSSCSYFVAADTVHGEYVEEATLRCDCDAMHAVDSFMITLYKKDDCIASFQGYDPSRRNLDDFSSVFSPSSTGSIAEWPIALAKSRRG